MKLYNTYIINIIVIIIIIITIKSCDKCIFQEIHS